MVYGWINVLIFYTDDNIGKIPKSWVLKLGICKKIIKEG